MTKEIKRVEERQYKGQTVHLKIFKLKEKLDMLIKEIFNQLDPVLFGKIDQWNSLHDLRKEYQIIDLYSIRQMYKGNKLLLCSDDSGTACLTIEEFNSFISNIESIKMDRRNNEYIRQYIESRISRYKSPRRGECVALRGKAYYDMILHKHRSKPLNFLMENVKEDLKMYNYLVRIGQPFPRELHYITIEHIKNTVFIVMNMYITKSLQKKGIFNSSSWLFLDNICRTLWEEFVNLLFCEEDFYTNNSRINYSSLFNIFDKVADQNIHKVRELDSAKTLMRLAKIFFEKKQNSFNYYFGILYGGIEIPYALYGYSSYQREKFGEIIPVSFSLNRVKKNCFTKDFINEKGLINATQLHQVMPEYFLNNLTDTKDKKAIVLDNNNTTGYSIKILSESLKKVIPHVDCVVAETNIQEIKAILEKRSGFNDKAILLSGKDLFCRPVGEYNTCFGLKDTSHVINRIKFITGTDNYKQVTGYDFDNTLFKTGEIHRKSWNKALLKLNIEFDVINLPGNSGLTFKEAAMNIFIHLSQKHKISLEKNEFIKQLCDYKTQEMLKMNSVDFIPIAKVVNLIKYDVKNTNILITNNCLDFVLHVLETKNMLKYFSFLICNDYAMSVSAREKVYLSGGLKPSIDAYVEATEFFDIPILQMYVGDHKKIDAEFAKRIGCKFTLI